MGYKQTLLNLVEKCRNILFEDHEYVVCSGMLKKIGAAMINSSSSNVSLDLMEIYNMSKEELSMFSDPECLRIVRSFGVISGKSGWRVETIYKLLKKLQHDILDNRINDANKKSEELDGLFRIIEEGLFVQNYNLLLDFVQICLKNNLLSVTDAINLNFYILKMCNLDIVDTKDQTNVFEIVELIENTESYDDLKGRLQNIFQKYGYVYDERLFGEYQDKFLKFADIEYVDYVLSNFHKYGITTDEFYLRKRAIYRIIIDKDVEIFNEILKFVDENNCTLSTMLTIPAIFSKRKRSYVERGKDVFSPTNNIFDVCGAYQYFNANISIYKQMAGISILDDSDLCKLGRFICTPTSLIEKNLLLLRRYGILHISSLPKAIVSLCGTDTEYIIDQMIENGLYDKYLTTRTTDGGEVKQPRGTYFLSLDGNPLKFYKMKRANDFGNSILANNGGIRKVFRDNNEDYMGISLSSDGKVLQTSLSLDTMKNINSQNRKSLPTSIQRKIDEGKIDDKKLELLYFDTLYKYKILTPVDIFSSYDKLSRTNLKGYRINELFKSDHSRVLTNDEISNILMDNFIKLLDNSQYCDSNGESVPLKTSELTYEFMHPDFPNVRVIISRYKVLRLCKLLKEDGCWINFDFSKEDKENTMLSVLLKDTIVSEVEMLMMREIIKNVINYGLINVSSLDTYSRVRRGVR